MSMHLRPVSLCFVLASALVPCVAIAQDPPPAASAAPAPAPAAATPAAAPAAAAPASGAALTADEDYNLKMRDLEERVGELKEQIFRSKAKLQSLTEQVMGGAGAGASVVIVHKNEMSGAFLLTEAHYYLDGAPLWNEVDEDGEKLTAKLQVPVWDGNIVEGSHTLTVNFVYRGNGKGVFSYLSGYTFRLKDSVTFTAEPGKVVSISSVGYEKGNFTTEMTERPGIRFDTDVQIDSRPVKKAAGGQP